MAPFAMPLKKHSLALANEFDASGSQRAPLEKPEQQPESG
jgi:hypothetical protein